MIRHLTENSEDEGHGKQESGSSRVKSGVDVSNGVSKSRVVSGKPGLSKSL